MGNKRGRPKNAPRPERDEGTPEMQMRRLQLVGHARDQRAERPIGVMEARGFLTARQADILKRYAGLFRASLGRNVNGERGKGGSADPAILERITEDFRAMQADLMKAGSRAKNAVENAVVYERWPHWLLAHCGHTHVRESDDSELGALMRGIAQLCAEQMERAA